MKVTVTVKYSLGHSYNEEWEGPEYFCPHCGKKEVWAEQSEGDYYVGPQYLCVNCGGEFKLPSKGDDKHFKNENNQRIEQIKASHA